MNKEQQKELIKKGIKFAMVDQDTVDRIEKIKKATGSDTISVINAAVQVLEKSLGRKLIVQEDDTNLDLTINKFKKFDKVSEFGTTASV